MTVEQFAVVLTAAGGLIGATAVILKAINDRRAGISSHELEARAQEHEEVRDTIADRDGLIASLTVRLGQVEDRLTAMENDNVRKALTIRDQGDHIDALEHHIYLRLPPPPPRRPKGL